MLYVIEKKTTSKQSRLVIIRIAKKESWMDFRKLTFV